MTSYRAAVAALVASLALSACAQPTATLVPPTSVPPTPAGPIVTPPGGIRPAQPSPSVVVRPGAPATPAANPATPPTPAPGVPRLSLPYTPVTGDAAVIVDRSPEEGERLDPEGAISVSFDRPMNTRAVEAAFQTQPAVSGRFTWSDGGRKVAFKPATALARDAILDIGIDQSARGADGTALREPFVARFLMRGNLEVAQVIPADGSVDVVADIPITVLFNRPVVPLAIVSQGAGAPSLPQPLSFEPPIEGKAEWLNTSILVFRPSRPLPGGTTYHARIDGALKDVDGNPLAGEVVWAFSTNAPQALSITPDPQLRSLAPVDTLVTARFNQDIDPDSARAAFALLDARGGSVPGALSVVSDTLTFTPSARLDFDAAYTIRVAAGVRSLYGGLGSREETRASFTTFPKPRVIGTSPENGARDAYPYGGISIQFSAPVDPASVWARLRFTPAVSLTRAFTSYYESENIFNVSVFLDPSTDYTLSLLPGVSDRWGNTIAETTRWSFRTAQLPPSVNLSLTGSGGTYNAYLPVRAIATTNNVATLNLELYALSDADVTSIRARSLYDLRQPMPGQRVRQWQVKIEGEQNRVARTLLTLGDAEGRLKPGGYALRLISPDLPSQNQQNERRAIFFVSELNLTEKREVGGLLIWATDLKTGQPVSGLSLRAFEVRYTGGAPVVAQTGSGVTGADGVARFGPGNVNRTGASGLVVADGRFGIVFEDWSNGVNASDFGLTTGGIGPGQPWRGFLYTDRAIYRPGQMVRLRGIVRADDDGVYAPVPAGQSVKAQANGPRGSLFSATYLLDEQGAFDAEFVLPADTALGTVSLYAAIGDRSVASASFVVAAYRPPEYEVKVTPSTPEVARGDSLEATLAAEYLSGGGLGNARMSWNVVASAASFNPPQLDQYRFVDSDDPWRPYPLPAYDMAFRPGRQIPPLVIARGDGLTDGRGHLQVGVPVSAEFRLTSGQPLSGPVQFSIEGNVAGPDGQSIAGRASVLVHPAALYVGVASGSSVVRSGKPLPADLVVVDWAGKRLAGRELEVSLVRREWTNRFDAETGRWTSAVSDEVVDTQKRVTGANGEAKATFSPEKAGTYRVVARARDAQGRLSQSSRFVFVIGDQTVSWLREDNDRINLVSDKALYAPGDTAEVLIPSPFAEDHLALVTLERGRILSYQIVVVRGGSAVVQIPITDRDAPNIFVSAVAVKGMTGAGAVGPDLADYKAGMLELTVKPVAQVFSVTITPDRRLLQPGEAVTFDIKATDAAGQPVAAAFSLDVVDKGVLNLRPRQANAIVDAFYGRRAPGTQLATTLNPSLNRRFAEEEQQLQIAAKESGAAPAPMQTMQPAAAPAPGALRAAGAGEDAGAAPAEAAVRENFADTAYWAANVRTNAAGEASVSVKLPDNLTTWVVRAVGADRATRVAEGLADAVATRPLLIRPVTPRFLVVGDEVELAAVVQNNTDAPQRAQAWLAEFGGLALRTPTTVTVDVPARGETLATWRAGVLDVKQVDVLFRVVSDAYGDASRPRLSTAPNGGITVLRFSAREIVGTAGAMDAAGTRSELVVLPPLLDASQGTLSLRIDHSLIASTQSGLDYLEAYRYETAETVASRLVANSLSYQLLAQFPAPDAALLARMKEGIAASIDKLLRQQRQDGGWAWWREGESNPTTTLWAVFALGRAKQAGFAINPAALERGLAFARRLVVATVTLRGVYAFNQQAYALYVLGEAGAPDRARLGELYEARDNLGVYGRALLGLAIGRLDPKDARLKTLFADLSRDAVLSATGAHWEEKTPDWWGFNTDTRSTALVISALARLDAQNGLAPNAVRWLMAARTAEGVWKSAYESAWAMIALIDWATATGELKANYDYSVLLNGKRLGQGVATRETLAQTQIFTTSVAELLRDTANRITLQRSAGDGRLYYTAHLRAALPASAVQAIDRGIIVQRRYTQASCADGPKCPDVTEAKVGDALRVNLTLIAPSDLRYAQLEDALPAGAEAEDAGLATTSQLATGVTQRRADVSAWYRWWWNWYVRAEIKDDRVALFAPYLSRGTYEYSYTIRVTQAGRFNVIPTIASQQYLPEVFGRGDGALLVFER